MINLIFIIHNPQKLLLKLLILEHQVHPEETKI